jgi:outer membrane immunogenic protein
MRGIALTLALLGALGVSSGFAADIAVKAPAPAPIYTKAPLAPPFTWTGVYVGGFAGGGWGSEDPTDINQYAGTEGAVPAAGHTWAYSVGSTPLFGGMIGANYQAGQFVVGVEAQVGYVHLSGSGPDPLSRGLDVVSSSTLGDWYWLPAGRVGYAWDRTLFYGKAGVVFTQASATITDSCAAAPCGPLTIAAAGSANNQASFAGGGGIEYAFTNNLSARLEYMYWSLHNQFNVAGTASNGFVYNWSHSFSGLNTVTFGLSYAFH